ncbi:MAG: NUDIX domain-containing protein [Magnetococcales bacterium]|nr:NUDIX domain-containing protein [Magnetococcales bacterium]
MASLEYLHATDRNGCHVKTAERKALLAEMRDYSRRYGDAPWAVPVVHVILLDSSGMIRLVQRGDKEENPFMWDKAVGGHVVWEDPALPREAFVANLRKEVAEEVGIEDLLLVADGFAFRQQLLSGCLDLQKTALLQLIDVDPWQAGISRVRQGEPWLKRQYVATYFGIHDGPFRFLDGEAQAERRISKRDLMMDVLEQPWLYADGVRIFMQRYYHLLRLG